MIKKVFYISLFLFILTLIFLAAYNFVFRNNPNDPIADPKKKQAKQEEKEEKTAVPATEITSLLNENILGATSGIDEKIYYYSLDEKSLKKASLEGKDKTVLLSNLPGDATRVLWSPKKDKALLLLKLPDGTSNWYFSDIAPKTLVALKPTIGRLAWNNLGDKIIYQYTDPGTGKRTFNIANPDGSAWKEIAPIGARDSYVAPIPQSTNFSFWNRPNALEESLFESVDGSNGSKNTLVSGRFGADYLWSPTGDQVLIASSDKQGGNTLTLSIANKQGGEIRSLSIPTLLTKVTWAKDGKSIYYALPGGLPDNATLPNDYFEKPLITNDTFWKMDIETGRKSRLLDLKEVGQSFDSSDLFLSPQEDFLFFTDRSTKRLYRIEL